VTARRRTGQVRADVSPAPPDVTLQGLARFRGLPARATILRWVRLALLPPAAPGPARIVLRLVDGHEGRQLNRTFRQSDHATNVLTFDYSAAPLWADIVLCVPVIRREARARRRTLRDHLAHLVIHGMLHAQGHDHQDRAQARAMEAVERRLLETLGISDPYVVLD
jgi:probable rRNA maturation factor